MELQQSPEYARYVTSLGWTVITIDGIQVFFRHIPIAGVIAKIQRPGHLPFIPTLIPELKKHHVKTIAIEPIQNEDPAQFSSYVKTLRRWFRIYPSNFLPTKTIAVPLTGTEEQIFSRLSSAKRRAVRRAAKNHIQIVPGSIDDLIGVKARSAGLFGGITTYGADRLYDVLGKQHTDILLAILEYPEKREREILGGVFLIHWNKTTFYWIAGATRKGKKLFAPTLLVWESFRKARAKKSVSFDFLGVWDERLPKENHSWLGFTKFKEGFGGVTLYYPIA